MIPLTILGRFWGLLSRLGSLAGRYPVHCALVASLALCWLSWQRGDRYRDKLASTVSAYQSAQREALAAAEQAKSTQEAKYRSLANAADERYQAGLASGSSRLAAYIAAHRVRPQDPRPASQAIASAQDRGAAIPENLPTPALVALPERDVQACDQWVTYGMAAREWALGLNRP